MKLSYTIASARGFRNRPVSGRGFSFRNHYTPLESRATLFPMTKEELLLDLYAKLSALQATSQSYGAAGGRSEIVTAISQLVSGVAAIAEGELGKLVVSDATYKAAFESAVSAKKG